MNIHEAVLQPIAAFVYCNRHAAASDHDITLTGSNFGNLTAFMAIFSYRWQTSRKFPRTSRHLCN